MSAGVKDLTIERGATFTRTISWKDAGGNPINLLGYSARMQARRSHSCASAFIDIDSSSKGGIDIDEVTGIVTISLTAAQTSAIRESAGVYDIEMENASGVTTRLLEGKITISPEVTR